MYRIFTDTSSNLPLSWLEENRVAVLPFFYRLGEGEYRPADPGDFDASAYYGALRSGVQAATSQIPPQQYIELFTPVLEGGEDLLLLSMSSGISGSFQSAQMAAAELAEHFPERTIRLVDTLGASLGEGLQVMEAVALRDRGVELDAAADALEDRRKNVCQLLMVDDLMHLRRTGRVSGVTAVVGSLLGVKPILKGDSQGRLVVSEKVRGRKQAIRAMAQRYQRLATDAGQHTVGIAHADCPRDAQALADMIAQIAPPKDILTVCYEPVTGAHTGPDALALFFYGADDVRRQD